MSQFYDDQITICVKYGVAGLIAFILGTIHTAIFTKIAANITKRIEFSFFESLLRQELGFYDENTASEFNSRLSDDIYYIQAGIGDKVTNSIQFLSQGIAGIVVGFLHSWALSLLIFGISPLISISIGLVLFGLTKLTKIRQKSYAEAGSVAEEVINNIRTVTAFGGQKVESVRYLKNCEVATRAMTKQSYFLGASVGLLYRRVFVNVI